MYRIITIFITAWFLVCCYPLNEEEEIPKAPSELVATIETSTQGRLIRLHWLDNSNNETGFKLARRIGTGMYWVIQMIPANSTSYDDYPPITEFGTTYSYKIRAVTNYYSSEYSNDVVITFM
jgi:hypothetical protein